MLVDFAAGAGLANRMQSTSMKRVRRSIISRSVSRIEKAVGEAIVAVIKPVVKQKFSLWH
jgi:hypothetical protein